MRTKTHRYIRYRDGSEELYDLVTDPNEWSNTAALPRSETLKKDLATFFPETNAESAESAEGAGSTRKKKGKR